MIRIQDEGEVRVVTLDRPDRRNALTREGLADLAAAVRDADAPVVYLHGAGPAFCAGADLDTVRGLDGDAAAAYAERGQAATNAVEDAEPVVVAGVDGAARGGGVELALACDLRVATPDATFAEPGVSMGIFGAWGGTRRLPAVVGDGPALDLSLSGRVVDADNALRMGLVSRVTDDPRAVADEVAANDPRALARLKRLLRDRSGHDAQEKREAAAFADLIRERDG
jgi:enoyl-CoA hydratase/carnithine racemase